MVGMDYIGIGAERESKSLSILASIAGVGFISLITNMD